MTDHLLRKALEEGYISEKYLHKLLMENPDEQMVGVIDTIHTLFCSKGHDYHTENLGQRDRERCYYYPENVMSKPWTEPDRKYWAEYTIELLSKLCLILPDEMKEFTQALLKVGETTIKFLDRYPAARDLVVRICELERP